MADIAVNRFKSVAKKAVILDKDQNIKCLPPIKDVEQVQTPEYRSNRFVVWLRFFWTRIKRIYRLHKICIDFW